MNFSMEREERRVEGREYKVLNSFLWNFFKIIILITDGRGRVHFKSLIFNFSKLGVFRNWKGKEEISLILNIKNKIKKPKLPN